jgi:hypothetical protein
MPVKVGFALARKAMAMAMRDLEGHINPVLHRSSDLLNPASC